MTRFASCLAATLLVMSVPVTAAAQAPGGSPATPEQTAELSLSAQGGVSVTAPDWKKVRTDEAVAVVERAPDAESRTPFAMLLVAIEEGPSRADDVDWDKIRDNIVQAAKDTGSEVKLTLQPGTFDAASGFTGRRLVGTIVAKEREVAVHMVALVAADVLVTVSALGAKDSAEIGPLVDRVAATAKRAAGE